MSQGISLSTALCLSESDSAALISGQSIAALSRAFINSAQRFALCSVGDTSMVMAWAEHDSCRMYVNPDDAEALSWHTIWPKEFIQGMLQEKNRIFLNTLRVYRLDKPIEIEGGKAVDKIGGFIKLPKSIDINKIDFVLSETTFVQRLKNLQKLSPPEHPELKALQAAIALYAKDTPVAQSFDDDLQRFLGWATHTQKQNSLPDWIKQITILGHRSEETEENKKSHYQAGTDFEIAVRNAFKFLGFTMDESHQGKAGGIDVFCAEPYSIVIECKSGKSIPDNTSEELERIAKRHLKDNYQSAVKLIIGPGKPTRQLTESATISRLISCNQKHSNGLLNYRSLILDQLIYSISRNVWNLVLSGPIQIRKSITSSIKSSNKLNYDHESLNL
jgi:hypothetical protein